MLIRFDSFKIIFLVDLFKIVFMGEQKQKLDLGYVT